MTITVESTGVADGQPIAGEYAVHTPTPDGRSEFGGADRSPHLAWSGEPEGTRSFALSVVDPDVPADRTRMDVEGLSLGDDEPRVDFAHWLVVDIPADVHELPEAAGGEASSRTAARRTHRSRAPSPDRTATAGCSRATRTSRGPTAGTARSRRGTTSSSTTT